MLSYITGSKSISAHPSVADTMTVFALEAAASPKDKSSVVGKIFQNVFFTENYYTPSPGLFCHRLKCLVNFILWPKRPVLSRYTEVD